MGVFRPNLWVGRMVKYIHLNVILKKNCLPPSKTHRLNMNFWGFKGQIPSLLLLTNPLGTLNASNIYKHNLSIQFYSNDIK